MANARPRDMRAGFDIFRRAGGDVSFEELNQKLVEAGYGPIASRSYDHYRKLLKAGVERYIAINRFDVARASAPYDNASANGRYHYIDVKSNVQVLFAKRSQLYEAYFVADEVGETGAVLRLLDSEYSDGLHDLGIMNGDMISARFVETGRVVNGQVIELDLQTQPPLLEIEFSGLLSLAIIGGIEPRPLRTTTYRLRAENEGMTSVDVAGRRVYYFFELVEGLRSVANLIDEDAPTDLYSPPTNLSELRIASSPIVALQLADLVGSLLSLPGLGTLVATTLGAAAVRKQFWDTKVAKNSAPGERARSVAAVHEARRIAAEADLKELELAERKAEAQVKREVLEVAVRHMDSEQDARLELLELLIATEVLPALKRLGAAGIQTIEVVDDRDPDEESVGSGGPE